MFTHAWQRLQQATPLRQTDKADFNELRSYAKPPLCFLAIFEGIGILLDPSKEISEWTDEKKFMAGGRDAFLQRLFTVDKDNINDKQLEKLKSILARDDCQPSMLESTSILCSRLGVWLRAIVEYAIQHKQTH